MSRIATRSFIDEKDASRSPRTESREVRMEGLGAVSLPHRTTHHFEDPVEFSTALPGGRFECITSRGRAFEAKVEFLRLPGLSFRRTVSTPHVSRAALEAGTTTLFIQTQRGDAGLRINGMTMPRSAVGGTDLTLVAERHVGGVVVQLPFDLTRGFCEGWSLQLFEDAGVLLLDEGPASRCLADELRAAADVLGDPSDTQLAHEHVHGLALSLRDRIAAALAEAGGPRAPQRALLEAVRVVRRVDDLLLARLSEPIYTTQLCEALRISPRKLHDATIAVCGMSPHAYLKARRLSLARRALLTTTPEARLVKRVALAHGFWHFGNFAGDYRKLFGETPSETLARAVGAVAAQDRDGVRLRRDPAEPGAGSAGRAARAR
jgi:AraC family ethanolamine operon transcriptional activator